MVGLLDATAQFSVYAAETDGQRTLPWFELWSVLVAAIGVALALASLIKQLHDTYWSRPVIVLDAVLVPGDRAWSARIIVTNVGERAVTITAAGWWYGYGGHFENIHQAARDGSVPRRLEPHDTTTFSTGIPNEPDTWLGYPGLFRKPKRIDSYNGAAVGAWRNDERPDQDRFTIPYIEIVRRPRNRLVGFVIRLLARIVRRYDHAGWNRLSRPGAPRGHERAWGRPLLIPDLNSGL